MLYHHCRTYESAKGILLKVIGECHQNVYLIGSGNNGKTYLINEVLNQINNSSHTVLIEPMSGLIIPDKNTIVELNNKEQLDEYNLNHGHVIIMETIKYTQ